MIARMCLSDLHLGDARSVLSSPATVASVVERLVLLARGSGNDLSPHPMVDTLVLNGDIWEECVPSGMGPMVGVHQKTVLEASVRFFGALLDAIDVRRVVWVPGNHDLSLWDLYCKSRVVDDSDSDHGWSIITLPAGRTVDHPQRNRWSNTLLGPLFGDRKFSVLKVAYPTFVVEPWDGGFPHIVFTHGHLLDRLVRGLDSDATYLGLGLLGCPRPMAPVDAREVCQARLLALWTDPFTLALWQRHSLRNYLYSNQIMRRLENPSSCPLQEGDWDRSHVQVRGTHLVTFESDPSSPRDGLMAEVPWFLDILVADPELPTPVGELRSHNERPVAFTRPSCLVYGHDHLGSQRVVMSSGVPYHVVDSGGWTSEHEGHLPHSHVLVWDDPGQVIPSVHLLTTRLDEESSTKTQESP